MNFNYEETTIVKHYAGSHAYGTNIEGSDVDMRGIFVAPEVYIRTPFFTVNEIDVQDEEDTKLYELTNFMKLYMDMNPNIVETLWIDQKDIITGSEVYDYLREHNQALLSKKAAFTFSGYAISQLKRIKGHNKWINSPQPEQKPRQIDYVSLVHNFSGSKIFKINMEDIHTNHRLIHYGSDLYGVYEAEGYETYDFNYTLNTNADAQLDGFYTKEPTFAERIAGMVIDDPTFGVRRLPKYLVKFNIDVYKTAKEQHKNYWAWKTNRNEKRSCLEEQFGYDTKHAMHLVRLLRMAEEILKNGVVNVKRPDALELLGIRNGEWKYEELLSFCEDKDQYIRGELYKKSELRKTPDIKLASEVLINCQEMSWHPKADPRILTIPEHAKVGTVSGLCPPTVL